MKKLMITWIGETDHDASAGVEEKAPGPIARTLAARDDLDQVHLLNNYSDRSTAAYKKWLRSSTKTKAKISSVDVKLTSPTDFGEVYTIVISELDKLRAKHGSDTHFVFNVSPGTYTMAAIFLLLREARYPNAELVEASPEGGVKAIELPFKIAADYVPDLIKQYGRRQSAADAKRSSISRGIAPGDAEFEKIVYQCSSMRNVIERSKRIATRSISVLIEGEPGTGRRAMALAIHNSRSKLVRGDFRQVPCGAMPHDQLERELFGHQDSPRRPHKGALEDASGGTLFLEEVDTLPPMLQVKLLRALDDRKVLRSGGGGGGGGTAKLDDIRCISSSTRSLNQCVAEGAFRTDLYYRLAGDVIGLPPLRDRSEDFEPLITHILENNKDLLKAERGFEGLKFDAGAMNEIKHYRWPGNIRELENFILRIATHSDQVEVSEQEVRSALRLAPIQSGDELLPDQFSEAFNLENVLDRIAWEYIKRARRESGGRITKAAKLLGYDHYQVLSRREKKLKEKFVDDG